MAKKITLTRLEPLSGVVSYHREGVSAREVERCLGILVRSADTVSFCVRKLKINPSLGEEGSGGEER